MVPWKALCEAYLWFSPDTKARRRGLRTVGRVVEAYSETHTADSYGGRHTSNLVRYEFEVDGRKHTDEKEVSTLSFLRRDARIRVYYLPDSYPPDSTIDDRPQVLAEKEAVLEEPGRRSIQESGQNTQGTILRVRTKAVGSEQFYGITYEFADSLGNMLRNTAWITDQENLSEGSRVTIYYLPEYPERNILVT